MPSSYDAGFAAGMAAVSDSAGWEARPQAPAASNDTAASEAQAIWVPPAVERPPAADEEVEDLLALLGI